MRATLITFLFSVCYLYANCQGWNWGRGGSGAGSDAWAIATDRSGNVYGAGIAYTAGTITFGGGVSAIPYYGGDYQLMWVKFSNSGTPLWAGGTSSGDCYLNNICTDPSGDLIVFGSFMSTSMSIGTTILLNSSVGSCYFIAKFDPSGPLLWAVADGHIIPSFFFVTGVIGTPYILTTGGVTTDNTGNIYITSSFTATSTIGSFTLTSAGGNDIFVAKYTSSGVPVWATSVGGTEDDYGFGISLSSTGNIYVCGDTYSPSATIGSSSITNPYTDVPEALIAEFSPTGTPLWAQASGGPDGAFAVGLASDNYGNVYMTGGFGDASITFGGTTVSRTYPFAAPKLALYLVQYSPTGVVTWSKTIGSKTTGLWGYCLAMASCGQIWLSGYYSDTATIDTATLNPPFDSNPTDDIFIAGYNITGGVVGFAGLNAGGDDQNGIACDGNGNVFICSDFVGSVIIGADTLRETGTFEYFYMGKYENTIFLPDTVYEHHDTSLCGLGSDSVTCTAVSGYSNYYWYNGSTDSSQVFTDTGTYWVYCITCGAPVLVDTFHLTRSATDTSYVTKDTSLCMNLGPMILTADTGYTSYTWNTGSSGISIIVGASGTYYVYDVGNCILQVDTFKVKFWPSPNINLGNDTSICEGDTLNLISLQSYGSTYLWNTGSAADSIIVFSAGTYKLTVIDSNGCFSTDSITVNVSPYPAVNLGPDISVCTGVTPTLQSSTTYTGASFLWSTGATTSSIVADSVGTYWLKVTIAECPNTDTVLIKNIYDTLYFSMTDTAICLGNSVFVRASGIPDMTFQWIPTAGIAVSNVAAAIIHPDTSAMYHLTATSPYCPAIEDSFFIDVQPNPQIFIAGARGVCQFDTIHLQAYVTPAWYTHYSFIWNPVTNLDTSTISNIVFTAGDFTNLVLNVSTPAGCSGKDSAQIYIYPINFAFLDTSFVLCPGDSIQFNDSILPGTVVSHLWKPSTYLSDSAANNPWVFPITSTTYKAIVTDQHGCLDTESVSVKVLPAAVIDLGDSVILYTGESYQVNNQTNCTYFSWFPGEGLSGTSIASPLIFPALSTKYLVYGKTEWGCYTTDSLDVYVDASTILAVPNAFSPGGTANPILYILKRGDATLNYFRIFNRWGNIVFETNNINEGWDGTYHGSPQPQGVFVYELEAVTNSGSVFEKHGNVTLLR